MKKNKLRKQLYKILDRRGAWQDKSKDMKYYQTYVIGETLDEIIKLFEEHDKKI